MTGLASGSASSFEDASFTGVLRRFPTIKTAALLQLPEALPDYLVMTRRAGVTRVFALDDPTRSHYEGRLSMRKVEALFLVTNDSQGWASIPHRFLAGDLDLLDGVRDRITKQEPLDCVRARWEAWDWIYPDTD